jgi:hypothetical protein
LAAEGSKALAIRADVKSTATTLANTALVDGDDYDDNTGNDQDTFTPAVVDLDMTKTAAYDTANDAVTYTLTVTNTEQTVAHGGTGLASSGFTVTDTLNTASVDLATVWFSIDGGTEFQVTLDGAAVDGVTLTTAGLVTWDNATSLAAEGSKALAIRADVKSTATTLANTALVDGDDYDDNTADNSDQVVDVDGPLSVNDVVVNEGSPFVVFEVTGEDYQLAKLSLANGTATEDDYGPSIQVFVGGEWLEYVPGSFVELDDTGKLLVRTSIVNDNYDEGEHDFTLTATSITNTADSGTAVINDRGEGTIFKDDGTEDTNAIKDDDRPKPAPIPPVISEPEAPPKPIIPDGEFVPPPPAKFYVPEPVPVKEVLTSSSGFRAAVIEGSAPALTLFKGIDDQFVESVGNVTSFALPSDAFAHTRAEAALTLEAKMADGTNLPAWVAFDGQAGVFRLTPPAGFTGELEIKVIARDNEGREAEAKFKLNVAPKVQKVGRESFSEKLKLAGHKANQWMPSQELRAERAERMAPHRLAPAERIVVKAKA